MHTIDLYRLHKTRAGFLKPPKILTPELHAALLLTDFFERIDTTFFDSQIIGSKSGFGKKKLWMLHFYQIQSSICPD